MKVCQCYKNWDKPSLQCDNPVLKGSKYCEIHQNCMPTHINFMPEEFVDIQEKEAVRILHDIRRKTQQSEQERDAIKILTEFKRKNQQQEKDMDVANILSEFKQQSERQEQERKPQQLRQRIQRQEQERKAQQLKIRPVGKPSLFERQLRIINKIRNLEDVRGIYKELLYTHNTSIPTFIKMLTEEYKYIRCCHQGAPIGYGAQFRYGLDSQYGEVKIIMKPQFWTKYAKGVSLHQKIVNYPVFADIFRGIEYTSDSEMLLYILSVQAANYNFRHLDQQIGMEDRGGMTCASVMEKMTQNRQSHTPLDQPYPSWCNIQLQLGENVDFNDISMVIVPGYLKNINFKMNDNDGKIVSINQIIDHANTKMSTLDGRPNPFRGKIMYSSIVPPEDYYSLLNLRKIISKTDEDTNMFYQMMSHIIDDSGKTLSSSDYMQRKSVMMWGNTSSIAVSSRVFKEETQLYMLHLVENDLVY